VENAVRITRERQDQRYVQKEIEFEQQKKELDKASEELTKTSEELTKIKKEALEQKRKFAQGAYEKGVAISEIAEITELQVDEVVTLLNQK
jgi:predicted transcriptional regulator